MHRLCSCLSFARTARLEAEYAHKSASEFLVEDGVEDRVDAGVGVAEPEEERVQLARHVAVRTAAVDDVDDEEPEPESAEECDDDRHPKCRPHLALFERALETPGRVLDRQERQSPIHREGSDRDGVEVRLSGEHPEPSGAAVLSVIGDQRLRWL